MKKLNVYDFDKTIYKKDATLEFWKFCIAKRPIISIILPYQILLYLLNKLSIISTTKFKQEFFNFLKYFDISEIQELLIEFWKKEDLNMNGEVLKTIFESKNKLICISASPKFLIEIPCNKMGFDIVIGTDFCLESLKIIGENCKGQVKVQRLNEVISDFLIENFYSDSYSDMPLFLISENKYFIKNGKIHADKF